MSTALYLGIGGSILLLIIIIVAYMMLSGKKEEEKDEKKEEEEKEEKKTSGSGGNTGGSGGGNTGGGNTGGGNTGGSGGGNTGGSGGGNTGGSGGNTGGSGGNTGGSGGNTGGSGGNTGGSGGNTGGSSEVLNVPAPPAVIVYPKASFSERFLSDCKENKAEEVYRCVQKGPGEYDMYDMGIDNDTLTTVRVPEGLKVILYDAIKFTGNTKELQKGDHDLPNIGFNDVTTSFKVISTDPNYKAYDGPKVKLSERFLSDCDTGAYRCAQKGPGDYDMREMGIANDTLSTVKVPPGFKLTLYDGDKFSRVNTDPLVLTEGEYDLPSRNFNDVTSSYKIERI